MILAFSQQNKRYCWCSPLVRFARVPTNKLGAFSPLVSTAARPGSAAVAPAARCGAPPARGSYEVLTAAAGTTEQLDEGTRVIRSPLWAKLRVEIWSQRPPLAASATSDANSPPDEPKGR